MELPSKFQINDEVTFRPMFRQQKKLGVADEDTEGRITAIKFTEAKVFYDVYSPFHGRIFREIYSDKVFKNVSASPVPITK